MAAAYVTRATVYSLKGDASSAAADYRQAIVIDPTNVQANDGLKRAESEVATTKPDQTSRDTIPNEPLPLDIPVSAEVLRLVETHPFFANAPPARVTAFSTLSSSEMTIRSPSLKATTSSSVERTVAIRRLRPGIVQIEDSSRMIITVPGAKPETNLSQYVSLSVAGGFIQLGGRSTNNNQYGSGAGIWKTVKINNLVGHLFPMVVGNQFSYELVSEGVGGVSGIAQTKTSSAYSDKCTVVRRIDAHNFHPNLSGSAYVLRCEVQTTLIKPSSITTNAQSNSVFFDELGYLITVDTVSPKEQIAYDGENARTGKQTTRTTGTATLKSFSLGN